MNFVGKRFYLARPQSEFFIVDLDNNGIIVCKSLDTGRKVKMKKIEFLSLIKDREIILRGEHE